jgi:hypothetical protein
MGVGGLERFRRMCVSILGQFDQDLLGRHLGDGHGDRLVREAIDAGPEGTPGTGTAQGIVGPLFVRAADDPIVVECLLDPPTMQPIGNFGCDQRIISDVARFGAPRSDRIRFLLSGTM